LFRLRIILIIIVYLAGICNKSDAQDSLNQSPQYANKDIYLVDSLKLYDFKKSDKLLVDSCLQRYHAAQSDVERIKSLDGITNNMVADAPSESSIINEFFQFIGDIPIVAHNTPFDLAYLEAMADRHDKKLPECLW